MESVHCDCNEAEQMVHHISKDCYLWWQQRHKLWLQDEKSCGELWENCAAPSTSWQHGDWGSKHSWLTIGDEKESVILSMCVCLSAHMLLPYHKLSYRFDEYNSVLFCVNVRMYISIWIIPANNQKAYLCLWKLKNKLHMLYYFFVGTMYY